jgi:hypothetical protein
MIRSIRSAFLGTLALLVTGAALAGPAIAGSPVGCSGVPDPRFSTVPSCLNTCPAGDLGFTVTIRDVSNAPLCGTTVVLSPVGCPGQVTLLCADCPELSGYDSVNKTFTRVTDANGQATFRLCGTVYCPGGGLNWVQVSASGVVLANATFLTTDPDHDLDVDAADVALVTAALGAVNHPADQDCNHVITAADVAAVSAHAGHHCSGAVPTLPRSWGMLKAGYR